MPFAVLSAVAIYFDLHSPEHDVRGPGPPANPGRHYLDYLHFVMNNQKELPALLALWRKSKAYLPALIYVLDDLLPLTNNSASDARILPVYVNVLLLPSLDVVFALQLLMMIYLVELRPSALPPSAEPLDLPLWRCHVCNTLMDDDDLLISCVDCHRPVHSECSSVCRGRCGLRFCNPCLPAHPCRWTVRFWPLVFQIYDLSSNGLSSEVFCPAANVYFMHTEGGPLMRCVTLHYLADYRFLCEQEDVW